jgi:phosphate transport system substrate-binding protein
MSTARFISIRWPALLGALCALACFVTICVAEPVRLHGSTTFAAEITEPYRAAIEREAGHPIEVVGSKSSWGLFALLEGRADLAMISAPLASEIDSARSLKPGLPYEKLQAFHVSTTRIAFVVHPTNGIKNLPMAAVVRIFKGEIVNWRDVGGEDRPIRVVATNEGGGTVAAFRAAFLGTAPLPAAAIRLESAKHVLKAVSQERGAVGIAQLGLVGTAVNELITDQIVQQPLSLVSLGEPSPGLARIIDATRAVASHAHH